MKVTAVLRRALPLGLALATSACDLADLINNPAPRFEQTWNVPADSMNISVGSLLPPGVSIYSTPSSSPPDSSAFQVALNLTPVSRRIGDDCAQCQTLDGQTTIKPAFVLSTGSTSSLPADVVSGALVAGQVNVAITNTGSFDPLRVKVGPGAQGFMLIVLRSGSLVVGRDSVNGATTTLAPGATLNRVIALQSGIVTGNLSVDVTLNSPVGDQNVPIDASGRINGTATVPDFRFTQVRINVNNRSLVSPGTDSLGLEDLDEGITDYVTRAVLRMTISNPFSVTGSVAVRFGYGPQPSEAVVKSLDMPSGPPQVRDVSLDATELQSLFGRRIGITISGGVSSAGPIDITPRQTIVIGNRLIMTVLTGSSN